MLNPNPSILELDFYYDETNNIRKLYLTDKKQAYINTKCSPFILGGIAIDKNLDKSSINESIGEFLKKIGMQNNQKEVKFKHVAHGDFYAILRSKKLDCFFDFLVKHKILMHLYVLDVVYWSLVDILESEALIRVCKPFFYVDDLIIDEVKSVFTEIVKSYKNEFFEDLFNIGYPDVISKKEDFIEVLFKYTKRFKPKNDSNRIIFLNILELLFSIFKKDDEAFCFLDNEPKHELINNFNSFYLFRIEDFKHSYHILDEERQVMDYLATYSPKLNNFKFITSNDCQLIQLSDVMIGFFRSLFLFLENIEREKISDIFDSFDNVQRATLKKFFQIYEESVNTDEKMVVFTLSIFDFYKFNTLRELCK